MGTVVATACVVDGLTYRVLKVLAGEARAGKRFTSDFGKTSITRDFLVDDTASHIIDFLSTGDATAVNEIVALSFIIENALEVYFGFWFTPARSTGDFRNFAESTFEFSAQGTLVQDRRNGTLIASHTTIVGEAVIEGCALGDTGSGVAIKGRAFRGETSNP